MRPFRNTYKFAKDVEKFDFAGLQTTVDSSDSESTVFGHNPRLTVGDRAGIPFMLRKASAIIYCSRYEPQTGKLRAQWDVDLGYKAMKCARALWCPGSSPTMGVCVSRRFDAAKALEACKGRHSMEYVCPFVVIVGIQEDHGNWIERAFDWICTQQDRLPLNVICKATEKIDGRIETAIGAMLNGFSFGNAQNWRLSVMGQRVHFYAGSDLEERFINVGFAMAGFERATVELRLNGHWKDVSSTEDVQREDLEYVSSWIMA